MSSSDSATPVAENNIDLIRERIWHTYTTPSERTVTTEATFQNVGSESISRFKIGNLPSSTRILEAFNASEERLVILNVNPPFAEIEFCDDVIPPGKYKIIRLKYTLARFDEETSIRRLFGAQFYILFRRKSFSLFIEQLFFSTETSKVEFGRDAGTRHEVLVNIHAPAGFELKYRLAVVASSSNKEDVKSLVFAETEQKIRNMLAAKKSDTKPEKTKTNSIDLSEKSRIYEPAHVSDFVQIRIPETTNNRRNIHGSIIYSLKPNKTERRFVMLTVFVLFGISLILNLSVIDRYYNPFLQNWNIPNLLIITNNFSDKFFEIAAGIATISIAIAALIRDPLASRARYGYLIITLACILAFMLFSTGDTAATGTEAADTNTTAAMPSPNTTRA